MFMHHSSEKITKLFKTPRSFIIHTKARTTLYNASLLKSAGVISKAVVNALTSIFPLGKVYPNFECESQ
jgi:hypothetical protein